MLQKRASHLPVPTAAAITCNICKNAAAAPVRIDPSAIFADHLPIHLSVRVCLCAYRQACVPSYNGGRHRINQVRSCTSRARRQGVLRRESPQNARPSEFFPRKTLNPTQHAPTPTNPAARHFVQKAYSVGSATQKAISIPYLFRLRGTTVTARVSGAPHCRCRRYDGYNLLYCSEL